MIELLVVISITALLMGILLPVLGKVRKQSKVIICQSNLRQWGLIFLMYADDNNAQMPAASN
ncbi:MAG: type II secretion system protein, partial [Planctomycetota bacterium]